MPIYHQLGKVPHKRHTVFKNEKGEEVIEEVAPIAEAPAEDAAMDEDIYDYDPSADVQEEEYDYDYDYDAEEEL